MRPIRSRGAVAFAAALVLAVNAGVGCGSTETVTVTEQSAAPETAPAEAPTPAKPKKKEPQAAPVAEEDLGGTETAVVPDLVGQDHQLAQDTLQAGGFYYLDETDCSGQGRLLLYDRNWTVVKQDPPGGSKASVDAKITLCSVQDGE